MTNCELIVRNASEHKLFVVKTIDKVLNTGLKLSKCIVESMPPYINEEKLEESKDTVKLLQEEFNMKIFHNKDYTALHLKMQLDDVNQESFLERLTNGPEKSYSSVPYVIDFDFLGKREKREEILKNILD